MFDDIEEEIGRRKDLAQRIVNMNYSFQDFLLLAMQLKRDNPSLRMGQAYFSALHKINPKKANELANSWLDPFNDDDKIGNFLYEVCATWEGYQHGIGA